MAKESKEHSYKTTLNLPETGFPMRGNLANREPKMLENWEKQSFYNKLREKPEIVYNRAVQPVKLKKVAHVAVAQL